MNPEITGNGPYPIYIERNRFEPSQIAISSANMFSKIGGSISDSDGNPVKLSSDFRSSLKPSIRGLKVFDKDQKKIFEWSGTEWQPRK